MKKIVLIITMLCITSPLFASLKKEVSKLEQKVDALAENEHKMWQEIKRLNLEIDRLEKEAEKNNALEELLSEEDFSEQEELEPFAEAA